MCPNCRAFITTSDKVCPYCDMKLQAPAAARRASADLLGGLIPHARFTTIVILLINAGFYLAEELPGLIPEWRSGTCRFSRRERSSVPTFMRGSGGGC